MKPTYLLEIWWAVDEQRINMSLIEHMGFSECKEHFDFHKMVNGKSATIFVFFSDYDIRDEQIFEAATRFIKGDYERIDIDLKTLEVTKSKGVDRTNPR